MSGSHAFFAPSSSARIIACPASAALNAALPELPAISLAASVRGTACHTVMERIALNGDDATIYVGTNIEVDHLEYPFTDNEAEAVNIAVAGTRRLQALDYEISLELQLPIRVEGLPAEYQPFGHIDVMAYQPVIGHLHVRDAKFGHIPVEAPGNAQLWMYALGAVDYLAARGEDPTSITVEIIQPEISAEGSTQTLYTEQLLDWRRDVLAPAFKAALTDDPPMVAGTHCRWCKYASACPGLRKASEEIALADYGAPPDVRLLLDDELAAVLNRAEVVETFIEAVREESFARLNDGRAMPGWALVPKQSRRKWTDAEAVLERLTSQGYPLGEVSRTEVLSPAQLQKKSAGAYSCVESLVDSTPSGTKLGRVSDGSKVKLVDSV